MSDDMDLPRIGADGEPLDIPREDAERLARLLGTLDRSPVHLPGLRQAVMTRIRAEDSTTWARMWGWITAPRISPATAALALAAGLIAIIWTRSAPAPTPSVAAAATPATAVVPVRLVFVAPRASSVSVTGDFASWDPAGVALTRPDADGVWSVELKLAPGLHHYVFVIDGHEWRPDPNAASQVDDGFGEKNSVLLVASPRSS